jgi:guanylate kinase
MSPTVIMQDVFPGKFGFSVSHTTRGPRPGEEDGVHYHFVPREKMLEMIAAGEFIEHAEVGVWPNDSQFGSVAGSAAWAVQVHTNFYGTSKAAVSSVSDSGRICILDIDIQGVKAVKALPDFGARCGLYAMALAQVDQGRQCSACSFVFITAPNVEALEKRLRGRGTETEEKIQVFLEATLTRSARAANDQQRSSAAQWGRLKSAILQVRLKNALAEIEYGQAPGNFEHVIVNDDLEIAFTQLCTAIGLVPPPLRNTALVFVKPHAVNDKVPRRAASSATAHARPGAGGPLCLAVASDACSCGALQWHLRRCGAALVSYNRHGWAVAGGRIRQAAARQRRAEDRARKAPRCRHVAAASAAAFGWDTESLLTAV